MLLGIPTLLSGFVTVLFGLDYLLGIAIPLKLSFAAPYVPEIFWASVSAGCVLFAVALMQHKVEPGALALMAATCALIAIIAAAPVLNGHTHSGYVTASAWMALIALVLMGIFSIAGGINWWRLQTEASETGEQTL
jgi:lysylphosphatidylglycerol synthetase-like protein (DUF2156 family)